MKRVPGFVAPIRFERVLGQNVLARVGVLSPRTARLHVQGESSVVRWSPTPARRLQRSCTRSIRTPASTERKKATSETMASLSFKSRAPPVIPLTPSSLPVFVSGVVVQRSEAPLRHVLQPLAQVVPAPHRTAALEPFRHPRRGQGARQAQQGHPRAQATPRGPLRSLVQGVPGLPQGQSSTSCSIRTEALISHVARWLLAGRDSENRRPAGTARQRSEGRTARRLGRNQGRFRSRHQVIRVRSGPDPLDGRDGASKTRFLVRAIASCFVVRRRGQI